MKNEINELDAAIKFFKEKIAEQGRITNARDEEHLQRLIEIKKQIKKRES